MGLINHSEPLSTSEVGLNFWPRAAQGLWSRLVAPTGTNAPPLVPVGATNWDQRCAYISQHLGNFQIPRQLPPTPPGCPCSPSPPAPRRRRPAPLPRAGRRRPLLIAVAPRPCLDGSPPGARRRRPAPTRRPASCSPARARRLGAPSPPARPARARRRPRRPRPVPPPPRPAPARRRPRRPRRRHRPSRPRCESRRPGSVFLLVNCFLIIYI